MRKNCQYRERKDDIRKEMIGGSEWNAAKYLKESIEPTGTGSFGHFTPGDAMCLVHKHLVKYCPAEHQHHQYCTLYLLKWNYCIVLYSYIPTDTVIIIGTCRILFGLMLHHDYDNDQSYVSKYKSKYINTVLSFIVMAFKNLEKCLWMNALTSSVYYYYTALT